MRTGGWRLSTGVAILTACVVAPATAHAESCQWTRTNLPVPDGAQVAVTGGAPAGWVVGNRASAGAGDFGVVWRDDVVHARLDFAEGTNVQDVNNSGVVAGGNGTTSFRWTGGTYQNLPAKPGDTRTFARRVNAAGDVAGLSGSASALDAVVVWLGGSPGLFTVLPGTDDGRPWSVTDVDDQRRVVAWEVTAENNAAAYVWDAAGNRTRLQPLPGHGSAEPQAFRNGRIVGLSAPAHHPTGRQLVEWDLTGRIVRTFENGYALDVNSAGHVLGFKGDTSGVWRSATEFEPAPVEGWAPVLADNGDVYGTVDGVPYRLRCG